MTQTTINKSQKVDFVYDFTQRIFQPRFDKLAKKHMTDTAFREEYVRLMRKSYPQLQGDSPTKKIFAELYGVRCGAGTLGPIAGRKQPRPFAFLGDVCGESLSKNLLQSLQPVDTTLHIRFYPKRNKMNDEDWRKVITESEIATPPGVVEFDFYPHTRCPVTIKKSQDQVSGEVDRELVIRALLVPVIPKPVQKKWLALYQRINDEVGDIDALMSEASDFAKNLLNILVPIRTVKKLKEQLPDLWPEFEECTGLSENMQGKVPSVPPAAYETVEKTIRAYRRN